MKIKTLLIISICFILLSFKNEYGIDVDSDLCRIENKSFEGGEKLVYKLYYNWGFVWIPAGETTFYIKENEDTYEISVDGKTYPSYDSFFQG